MANKTFVSNGTFTVADNDAVAFGASVAGTEIVKIQSGVTGVKLDANFEQIVLSGNLSTYKFLVVSGTGLQILATDGTTVIATIPNLNQVVKLVFENGFTTLTQTGSTAFKLGDSSTVSTSTAGPLTPTLSTGYSVSEFNTAASTIVVSEYIKITDSASNTNTNLVALLADAKVDEIDATDSTGASTAIVLTYAQESVTANMAKLVSGDFVSVSDTRSVINTNLASLLHDAKVDSVISSGTGAVTVLGVDGTSSGSYSTTPESSAGAVSGAGKWYYATHALTIWDATHTGGASAVTIVLTGDASATADNAGVITIA